MKFVNHAKFRQVNSLVGLTLIALSVGLQWATLTVSVHAQDIAATEDVFRKENLVAWCIVPFDRSKRTPEQRAAMLEKMGVKRLAYDYRAEHIPTFQAEVDALKRHGIELTAWWFPTVLNDEAKMILDVLEKNQIKAQLWVTGGGATPKDAAEQQRMVEAEAARIRPIAEAAAKIGCTVGLYNHGGWFGEPENQIAIIEQLKMPNVGIVYNLHHGHPHLDRLPELMAKMKPYLLSFNLNGMDTNGDQIGKKILPIGEGTRDSEWVKVIRDSGYTGPIGILNHTDEDAEARLLDNLDGLYWLLDGQKTKKPTWRSWQAPPQPAISGGILLPDERRFRHAPLTLEMTAKIDHATGFNILAASDTKASHEHWELFTHAGSGILAVYLPGRIPDHVNANRTVTDGKLRHYAMLYELNRVRLYVDGELVADQAIERKGNKKPDDSKPEGFALGRLVEGGLFCAGSIQWARISSGTREITPATAKVAEKDDRAWAVWHFDDKGTLEPTTTTTSDNTKPATTLTYDPKLMETLVNEAKERGNAKRGIGVFADAKSACLSCHQIGSVGGKVGPALTEIGKQREGLKLVESLLWPNREVEEKFQTLQVLTSDGEVVRGYKVSQDAEKLVIRDPAAGTDREIGMEDVEEISPAGSLMPEGLVGGMGRQQQLDLIRLLMDLGKEPTLELAMIESALHQAHGHQPVKFPLNRAPIDVADWPHWETFINRDRLYEFYTKQAEFFRVHEPRPTLVGEFPGLDGGPFGHWGNQNEASWANDNWNNTDLGSVLGGVFNGPKGPIARAVCVALGDAQDYGVCFDPDTLTYEAFWKGGFLKFSPVRHGFINGLTPKGEYLDKPVGEKPDQPFKYLGYYRHGKRIVFAYRIGDVEYLDSPWIVEGKFVREVAPRAEHPLKAALEGSAPQWPQTIETKVLYGAQQPYAIDTIELPRDNPWKALIFGGDHCFLPDGSALYATMQGDIWHVSGIGLGVGESSKPQSTEVGKAVWRRFASGLHHALGIVADKDGIFVLGRDQITRLHDLNRDGEADYYECFSNAYVTSPAGHDYICGLHRDEKGYFFIASGNQGVVRISPDGKQADVVAVGFRNPDGLGLYPDGVITVPCSEGEWTPASMICGVKPKVPGDAVREATYELADPLFFGYRGPRNGRVPALPMVYLPRGVDNSAGGQVYISSQQWGPTYGNMVHTSFGTGTHFLLLRDEVDGQLQGGVVPMRGEFLSGAHRARFHPIDGQLYVSGMAGWGAYSVETGCFQRMRYTGTAAQMPVGFHVHENGIAVRFAEAIDRTVAENVQSHIVQAWNYRYSAAYGSPEFSTLHPGTKGHDVLTIVSAQVLEDGKTLFLEMPDLQPANQVYLRMYVGGERGHDLFTTVHKLDKPRTDIRGYRYVEKKVAPHPILGDLILATRKIPNPWKGKIADARTVKMEAGKNLSFETRSFKVKPGEAIALKFVNPDVVPHNWALIKPGKLQTVGDLANRLISDPEAAVMQYVPRTDDVLAYTDIVDPNAEFTIYFRAPSEPGRYPYLCTFPGHWMVMNGEMIVE